jgi:hypothetical protein
MQRPPAEMSGEQTDCDHRQNVVDATHRMREAMSKATKRLAKSRRPADPGMRSTNAYRRVPVLAFRRSSMM